MKRLLMIVLALMAVAAPAQAQKCGPNSPCVVELYATDRVKTWESDHRIPRNVLVDTGVTVAGRKLEPEASGLTSRYMGRGVVVQVRGKRRAAPLRVKFVSLRKDRLIHFSYFTERP